MKNLILFFSFFCFLGRLSAQVPEGYYSGTENLTGEALKKKLHQIIRNHKVKTYGEFRDIILPDLDEDPENPDNIILFYKGNSIPKTNFATNNQPDYWNREHTWPKSHGFPDEFDTAYTDVHNLRPSDASVNESKSNKDFNNVAHIVENEEGEAPNTYTTDDFWEPRDEIKGDVARILFYMDVRYESNSSDLELVDRISFSDESELGVLYTLLKWHALDPADNDERARHEKAYSYQENRNPFIDHPEWVSEIWGNGTDPLIILNQSNFNSDFGNAALGSSIVQSYEINGYQLTSDISVLTEAPFYLSTDEVAWTDSIGYADNGSEGQTFTVYLKFEPAEEDQGSDVNVIHRTEGDTITLEVHGEEADQPLISIAEARNKDLGEIVKITGVVIDAGNNSDDNRVIYDGTAGIVVRSFDTGNESVNLVQGDSITVSGGLSDYNGLLEIEESPIVITMISQNATLPNPQIVAIDEVGESLESQLVTIENVTFAQSGQFAGGGSAGNFTITDGENSLVFRLGSDQHPLVGSEIPSEKVAVTGIIGQFNSDYQMSPRTISDLEILSPVLSVAEPLLNELRFFPNPASSHIEIENQRAKPVAVTIMNIRGTEMYSDKIQSSKTIKVDHWPNGIYLLTIDCGDKVVIEKIVKK